jgi:hypothetical protein
MADLLSAIAILLAPTYAGCLFAIAYWPAPGTRAGRKRWRRP